MNALEGTAAHAGSQAPSRRRMVLGLSLCAAAALVLAGGWLVFAGDQTSTDNAYVRGDLTSLAAKVAGYVTAVEVQDSQSVRAGDLLFRIDDRDYRAHLAQATANVQAARARLENAEAESELQRALIRQAEARQRSAMAERTLASKTHERSRILVRTHAISQAMVGESGTARHRAEAAVLAATATLEGKGLDALAAGQAAAGLLVRSLAAQATVIVFDTAFMAVTLLFPVAFPILIGIKVALHGKAHASA